MTSTAPATHKLHSAVTPCLANVLANLDGLDSTATRHVLLDFMVYLVVKSAAAKTEQTAMAKLATASVHQDIRGLIARFLVRLVPMELTVPLPVSVKMKQPVHQPMALVHVKQVGMGWIVRFPALEVNGVLDATQHVVVQMEEPVTLWMGAALV